MSNDLTTNNNFDAYARQFGWLYDNSGNYRDEHWEWYLGNEPGLVLLRQSPDRVTVVRFESHAPTELWAGRVVTERDFDRMIIDLSHPDGGADRSAGEEMELDVAAIEQQGAKCAMQAGQDRENPYLNSGESWQYLAWLRGFISARIPDLTCARCGGSGQFTLRSEGGAREFHGTKIDCSCNDPMRGQRGQW
jgi:hypothetical protein